MRVSEIFSSIQGEGLYAGNPTCFVRLAGCDLRCSWCDTPKSLGDYNHRARSFTILPKPGTVEMTVEEVARVVAASGMPHVSITGGEPLIHPHFAALVRRVCWAKTLVVETNCENRPPAAGEMFGYIPPGFLPSLSPKIHRFSTERDRLMSVVSEWGEIAPVQLKIVATSAHDVREAISFIEDARDATRVIHAAVQPEAKWAMSGCFDEVLSLVAAKDIKVTGQVHKMWGLR